MTKQEFKAMFSQYRAILSGHTESRILSNGVDLNERYTNHFNWLFNVDSNRIAFCDNGCDYSFKFAWVFGGKGSLKKESILNRNAKALGL